MKFSLTSALTFARSRICSSRFTIAYFALSCLYCVLQTVIAVQGWAVNQYAGEVMKTIFLQANITLANYAHFESNTGTLHICQGNADSARPTECPIIWPMPGAEPTIVNGNKVASRSVEITKNFTNSGESTGLTILGISDLFSPSTDDHRVIHASLDCIQAMTWPVRHLLDQKREDVSFVGFQIWVMVMSCVAILHESIPHVWATFIMHLTAALWSALQLWSTRIFRANYSRLIMGVNDPNGYLGRLRGPGACDGQDLLPAYFKPRMDAGLVTAVLNFVSLFGSGYLAYRLIHIFGWNTFKHIGASVLIHRIYKLVLILTILIQLALFYIITSAGLWIDQLYSGVFGRHAALSELYKAWNTFVLVALIPWLILGWFSVRREWRRGMLVFNVLSAFFLMSWIAAIFSDSWRLTFVHWQFFAIIQIGAFTSCLLTLVLGVLCRVFCFGQGLPQYLNPPTNDTVHDFNPTPDIQWDAEKVEFPSFQDAIPQFTKPPPAILPRNDPGIRRNSFDTGTVECDNNSSILYTEAPAHGIQQSHGIISDSQWESRVSDTKFGAPHDRRDPKDWSTE